MASRRAFLKQTAAAAAVGVLASCRTGGAVRTGNRRQGQNKDGVERYEATVPDTLDLAERCRWALHGLAGQSDPEMYGQMWFWGNLGCREPYLQHNASDGSCTPKFAEAFPLLRWASGSEEFREIEQQQMDDLVASISAEDGIYYSEYRPDRPWHSTYHSTELVPEDWAWVGGIGRMMRAMATCRERDGDPKWDERIRKMARGLGKIAVYKDDYAYYPDGGHSLQFTYPKSGWKHTREPMSDAESPEGSVVDTIGHAAYGLARWHRMSGDEEALELARKITRFMMLEKMWGGMVEEIGVDGSEQGHFPATHIHG